MGTEIHLEEQLKHPKQGADYVQTCLTGWPKQPKIQDNQATETNVCQSTVTSLSLTNGPPLCDSNIGKCNQWHLRFGLKKDSEGLNNETEH